MKPHGPDSGTARRILGRTRGPVHLSTMTTTRLTAALALIPILTGCRLPDTWGVGYLDGSLRGTSTATLEAFGGPTNFEADTDLDNRAAMIFVAWTAGYPITKRNGERLERLEAHIIALRLQLSGGREWSEQSQPTPPPLSGAPR